MVLGFCQVSTYYYFELFTEKRRSNLFNKVCHICINVKINNEKFAMNFGQSLNILNLLLLIVFETDFEQ